MKKKRPEQKELSFKSVEPRLLDVKTAATYIGRTEYALRAMIAARKIPFVQEGPGHKIMFDRKELDRYIEQNTVPAEP